MLTSFQQQVFTIVKQIPKGETRTYKEIAAFIGKPRSFRAVGNALNKNNDASIPCHRVIRSDGKTGGYNRGADEKIARLRKELAVK